jgi:hypothetical protein
MYSGATTHSEGDGEQDHRGRARQPAEPDPPLGKCKTACPMSWLADGRDESADSLLSPFTMNPAASPPAIRCNTTMGVPGVW